jgi:hypothetical protein
MAFVSVSETIFILETISVTSTGSAIISVSETIFGLGSGSENVLSF